MDVTIDGPDGPMPAHLARPDDGDRWPGVVVVHDALGMTADLRRQADWLAANGYLALAPDLYHRSGRIRCMIATVRALASGRGPVFDDVELARSWLLARPDCTGRIGVIGFCMGGNLALAVAGSGGFDVSSVNYGDIAEGSLATLADACPVVASYGGLDRSLRDTPGRLEATLTRYRIDHDVEVYPSAGHGFLNDHAGETPAWALVAGWFVRTGYDEAAATHARERILAFFGRHLDR